MHGPGTDGVPESTGGRLDPDAPPAPALTAPLEVVAQALLEAIPSRVAVVDGRGVVVATNDAWRRARWPGGGDSGSELGPGVDLVASLRAGRPPTPVREAGRQLASGVERVLSGGSERWERVTDGAGPAPDSWHSLQVLPMALPGGGALVTITEITARVQAERRLAWQATHDRLTGLGNRVLLLDRLQPALRGGALALLLVDLDRFTILNDGLGHEAGDRLLQETASRLQAVVGAGPTVARLGGDSFAVMVEGADRASTADLAARIDTALRAPVALPDREVLITASIGGVAVGAGLDVLRRGDDLVREAEVALQRSRAERRPCILTLEELLAGRHPDTLDTEQDLRRALERGELRLEYQPEVSLESGKVLGAEALLRWHHPRRGVLVPHDFLALAEETGLIVPIGHWTLQQACRDAARWFSHEPAWPGATVGLPTADDQSVFVAVNLSRRQMADPELVHVIDAALAATGLQARRLCVEVTENVLFEDLEPSLATLRALRQRGVRIALDDFGTGYSSLSYLKELPVDVLKIDRSFVDRLDRDPRDQAVVAAVVTLARVFGLEVVAEGVEDAEQLDRLRLLGVQMAQGFDLARPTDAATVATQIRTG